MLISFKFLDKPFVMAFEFPCRLNVGDIINFNSFKEYIKVEYGNEDYEEILQYHHAVVRCDFVHDEVGAEETTIYQEVIVIPNRFLG